MTDIARVPSPPAFFELAGEHIRPDRHTGQQSWYVRGDNFVTVLSWAADGEVLTESAASDEHAVLVPEGVEVTVSAGTSQSVSVTGPAFAVVPAGPAEVTVRRSGYFLRVFTARGEVAAKAVNAAAYAQSADSAPLHADSERPAPKTLRVISMTDGPEGDGRKDQVFRTDCLLITWFAPEDGPHDTDSLIARVDDDYEHALVTLGADFVHHLRRPWTQRMRDWRPDEHVQITSPSVSLIPPGNIHITRAVGRGEHQLIDVFAPLHVYMTRSQHVVNAADYEPTRKF